MNQNMKRYSISQFEPDKRARLEASGSVPAIMQRGGVRGRTAITQRRFPGTPPAGGAFMHGAPMAIGQPSIPVSGPQFSTTQSEHQQQL
jgi:hypothetical protein